LLILGLLCSWGIKYDFANQEENQVEMQSVELQEVAVEENEMVVPNSLFGILQQMSSYVPQGDATEDEQPVIIQEKKTRGRPRKVKQVEGVIKHVQSENEPEGRQVSFKEQRDLEQAFRDLKRTTELSLITMIETLAKKFNLSYKQAHSILMT
jgi:hypothetical protein